MRRVVVIITRLVKKMKVKVRQLEAAAKKLDLVINKIKTKYMTWTDKEFEHRAKLVVTAEDGKVYTFNKIKNLRYLEIAIGIKLETEEEIRIILVAAIAVCMLRTINIKIYKSVIRRILIEGSKVWILKATKQKLLRIWQQKVLRKIYRQKRKNKM